MTRSASTLPKVVPAEIDPGLWDLVDTRLAGSVLSWKRALGTKMHRRLHRCLSRFPKVARREWQGGMPWKPMSWAYGLQLSAEDSSRARPCIDDRTLFQFHCQQWPDYARGVCARSLNPGLQVLVGQPGLIHPCRRSPFAISTQTGVLQGTPCRRRHVCH